MPSWGRGKPTGRPLLPCGTALHCAAFCGLHEVVRVLAIEHSEDVNSRSFNNKSMPLHLASQEGHVEVAQSLVEHGADAAAQSEDRRTLLDWVASNGPPVQTRHGSSSSTARTPQPRAKTGRLHHCIWRPKGAIWTWQDSIVFEHGADVAAQRKDGQTPLAFDI